MLDMNKAPLCYAPYRNVGSRYEEDGQPKMTHCCYRRAVALNESDWNGPEMCKLRKELAGLLPLRDDCKECLSYGDLSTAKLYGNVNGSYSLFGFDPETGRCKEENLTGTIYIGPKCQLGCRMCNGYVSTTYNYCFPKYREKPLTVKSKNYSTEVHKGSESVCIAGGESLLSPLTIDIIEQIDEKCAPHATAFIITNGAVELEGNKVYETIVRLKKRVWLMISLDADWDTHAWIRVGLDKELLQRNIKRMMDDGVLCGFNVIISSLNYNKWLFPIQLATELGIRFDITYVSEPDEFSCKYVPVEDRKAYAAEVIKWTRENADRVKAINNQCYDVLVRAAKALVTLPYEGEIKDKEKYEYLTRDVQIPVKNI